MEGIKIIKRPKLRDPYLIVAWPGMGEVAFKSAHYLVESLKAQECAEILADEFFYPTSSTVKNGVLGLPELPHGKFYCWKNKTGKNDLVIFISNAQPDLSGAENYCNRILSYVKSLKVKTIIGIAAMPQPVEHTQEANVWVTATSADIINSLKKYELDILSDGQISGMNGLFLGIAKKEGFQGFCLLGEIPLYTIQIENPKAACAVLEVLTKILNIQLDLSGLLTQAHIMEDEINKLLDYLKLGTPLGPIGEEEIEKIKKSLSQLTKLPVSVKEKIENLFDQAKTDIAKANELKGELDKWNVYKEYEDRFLDLFKKKKDKSN
jgi:uncharacterized protein